MSGLVVTIAPHAHLRRRRHRHEPHRRQRVAPAQYRDAGPADGARPVCRLRPSTQAWLSTPRLLASPLLRSACPARHSPDPGQLTTWFRRHAGRVRLWLHRTSRERAGSRQDATERDRPPQGPPGRHPRPGSTSGRAGVTAPWAPFGPAAIRLREPRSVAGQPVSPTTADRGVPCSTRGRTVQHRGLLAAATAPDCAGFLRTLPRSPPLS